MGRTLAGENKTSVEAFSDAGFVAEEDEKEFASRLEELIQKTIESEKKEVSPPPPGEDLIFRRFEGFTPWVIIGAGFLDGLNPCAFATIVFMVNLLLLLGHSRRRIQWFDLQYNGFCYLSPFRSGSFSILACFICLSDRLSNSLFNHGFIAFSFCCFEY